MAFRYSEASNYSPPVLESYSRPSSNPTVYDAYALMASRLSSSSPISAHHQQQQSGHTETDEEEKEKGRCPHPDCGRIFKDLKAHMLTHQSERPEKCPISTCEYHIKGFARKYDKNRHTLTHYKGTMVCGFCPGHGSPKAEKSFNRADVFKRHLTAVHGVEQTPPNSRKKSTASSNKKITDYCSDATGKCSTCSATFNNAQDFYEHLDDCVLRVIQQEEPCEAVNEQHLAEVASDEEVKKTMEKNHLVTDEAEVAGDQYLNDYHNDDDDADDDGVDPIEQTSNNKKSANRRVTKKPTTTGVSKRRNNNNNRSCPNNVNMNSSGMKMKKRVLCVFDGQRRLWKDEIMLNNSQFDGVKLKLPADNYRDAYITDLDLETMKRAEGIFSASQEERGPWPVEQQQMMELMGRPSVVGNPLPLPQPLDDDDHDGDDYVM